MKKVSVLLALSLTLFITVCTAQKPLSKETINSFYKAANYNYAYNLSDFKILINGYFLRINLEFSDAALAVEHIKDDLDSRGLVIQAMRQHYPEKNLLFNYMYDLGMTAIAAKELSEYAIAKYTPKVDQ